MKDKLLKIFSVFISCFMLTLSINYGNVSAESASGNIYVVIGTNEDDNCVMLSIGSELYQKTFQKYSGEDFSLSYGDVIFLDNYSIEPIAPGQLAFAEDGYIEYLGNVSEYYADSIKELTITEKTETGSNITLSDSDGKIYKWITRNWMYDYGHKAEIDPCSLNIGDTINCAVETTEYYVGDTLNYREEVILPIGKTTEPSSTTPAETTPTEITTTTVSTTITTELTTEPTETTTSTVISTMTILPTATTVTSITTTIPVETTVSETLDTTLTTITNTTTTTITSQPKPLGDADGDNELTVRDCSFIAITIAQGRNDELSDSADYNGDNKVNVRDAAAIAKSLAQLKS